LLGQSARSPISDTLAPNVPRHAEEQKFERPNQLETVKRQEVGWLPNGGAIGWLIRTGWGGF